MVLFEIHRRFKGHFLYELRVSFKIKNLNFFYIAELKIFEFYLTTLLLQNSASFLHFLFGNRSRNGLILDNQV